MLKSALDRWIQNPVCKVYFAGFESDTYRLQRSGWSVSARQQISTYSSGFDISLVLKHEAANLYALSNRVSLDYGMLHNMYEVANHLIFHLQQVSSSMYVQTMNGIPGSLEKYYNEFNPISCVPEYTNERICLSNLNIFKPLVETKEIVLGPKTVNEALEYVLKLQEPEQVAIREEKRKELARAAVNEKFNRTDVKPAYEIKAQIITLAS